MLGINFKTEKVHGQAPELYVDVWPPRELAHVPLPVCKYVVASSGVRPDGERGPDVVEHDWCVGKLVGEVGKFWYLRMEDPGVEREAVARQPGVASTKIRIEQPARREVLQGALDGLVRVHTDRPRIPLNRWPAALRWASRTRSTRSPRRSSANPRSRRQRVSTRSLRSRSLPRCQSQIPSRLEARDPDRLRNGTWHRTGRRSSRGYRGRCQCQRGTLSACRDARGPRGDGADRRLKGPARGSLRYGPQATARSRQEAPRAARVRPSHQSGLELPSGGRVTATASCRPTRVRPSRKPKHGHEVICS